MNTTASPKANSERRRGFTLVELLTVMAVISILVAMTAMMMGTVRESARKDQTRAVINTINEILLTKWESYATRPLPIVSPAPTENVSVQIPARESARVRLIMLRDLMRMEMPDRYSDVTVGDPRSGIPAPAIQIIARAAVRATDGGAVTPMPQTVTWSRTASVNNYCSRIASAQPPPPPVGDTSLDAFQRNASSELLYLILSTTSFNGVSAIEAIPKRNIRDTDGDGMLEIVDAWGNAIRFIRWPTGYVVAGMPISADEFDFMQVDWGYSADPPVPPASLKPLIISAGPDETFNIRFTQTSETPYYLMTWPLSEMGSEAAGRSSPYYYIDPYLRQYTGAGLIGDLLNTSSEEHLDNITNFNVNEST